jgi:hypothetical protein
VWSTDRSWCIATATERDETHGGHCVPSRLSGRMGRCGIMRLISGEPPLQEHARIVVGQRRDQWGDLMRPTGTESAPRGRVEMAVCEMAAHANGDWESLDQGTPTGRS